MSRIEKLKEFLAASPEDSFLQHALALEYIKEGNDAGAEVLFTAILEREPGYVGSYYHLGKLLERKGEPGKAMDVYRQGMQETQKIQDRHAYSELQGALEDLEE